jgi:hypothetical protein
MTNSASRSGIFFSSALALLVFSTLTASLGNRSAMAAYADGQQPQIIRSSTRLVQINVVAEDKNGAPLAGLTREDFELLDGGLILISRGDDSNLRFGVSVGETLCCARFCSPIQEISH